LKPVIALAMGQTKANSKEKDADISPILQEITSSLFEKLSEYKLGVEAELLKQKLEREEANLPSKDAPLEKSGSKVPTKRKAESSEQRTEKPQSDKEKLKEFPKKFDVLTLNFQLFSQGIGILKNGTHTHFFKFRISSLCNCSEGSVSFDH
jgi:hypothetical protein